MKSTAELEAMGMVPGVPGHTLSEIANPSPSPHDSNRIFMACSCGYGGYHLQGYPLKTGLLNSNPRRNWRNHLDGVTAPEMYIPIGRVNRKRITIDVVVMSSTYSKLASFGYKNSRYAQFWSIERIQQEGTWIVGHVKTDGPRTWHVIESSADTQQKAIDSAANWLRKQDKPDVTVVYFRDGAEPFDTPAFTPSASIAVLLDEIDACMDSTELSVWVETCERLDEALRLLPILAAKRTVLLERRAVLFGR